MLSVYSAADPGTAALSRPMVKGLFVATCLLSVVSWYTTWQGMALYLAAWFAVLASLGIQTVLVLVAWLIGFTAAKRALLIAVYIITAIVSIAFSYVSLYTWFSAQSRPAEIQRRLYDALNAATGRSQELLAGAVAEAQKHALALDEMTAAEKAHGFISRAQDADPYLNQVREAVAREAQTYSRSYPEGSGPGLRYTAFDRHARLTRQSIAAMEAAQRGLGEFRAQLQPLDPTEKQLRAFRQAYDTIPWTQVEESLHAGRFERPAVPAYADFVDRPATSQEDLLVAFQELAAAPTGRHVFALALAAFIDIVIFLVAWASGPYLFGSPEQRWVAGGAVVDSSDEKIFVRDFLRKLAPSPQGLARADSAGLSPGERQLCILLASQGLAVTVEEDGKILYLLDEKVHAQLIESLAMKDLSLRAAAGRAFSGAAQPSA